MAETAWNHEVYSFPHELCSCGDVAFFSTTISLCHHLCLKKTKLLPLTPPDNDTNTQACLAATQTPSGKKSEEIEEIAGASMAPVAVDVINMMERMVILRSQGNPSRNLLIQGAAYDTVHQRTILPIQEIKPDEMEIRKRRMVRMPNRDRE